MGLPGFLFDIIFGPFIRKRLRLQFFVLKNEDGTPLHATRDIVSECEGAYRVVESVLDREANIRVSPYGSHARVSVIDEAPPTAALEPTCGGGAFTALFGAAGSFFRKHKQWSVSILSLGYMAPISVFIVRDFTDGHNGCSVGTLADFVLVDLTGIEPTQGDDVGNTTNPSTTPAHEVGHACGIQWMLGSEHHSSVSNLMFSSKNRGTNLTKAQMAVVRSSRFVSYF